MRVGLISDSYDRVDALVSAVRLLLDEGADYFLHLGNLTSRRALEPFAQVSAAFVWGDQDRDRMGLLRQAESLQIQCFGVLGDFEIDGKRVVICHGDDKKLIKQLIKEGQHDYLITGSASDPVDEKKGRTRLVSPGPLHGSRVRHATLLDVETGDLKDLKLPASG